MKGKITITVDSLETIEVDVKLTGGSVMGCLILLDALAISLDMDRDELGLAAGMFAAGGLSALPGVTANTVAVDRDAVSLVRKMWEEKGNETAEI